MLDPGRGSVSGLTEPSFLIDSLVEDQVGGPSAVSVQVSHLAPVPEPDILPGMSWA